MIPIYSRKVKAGDSVTIDMKSLIQSQPLVSQLLGTFKFQAAVYFDSDTNYYSWMDNNSRNTTEALLKKTRFFLDTSGSIDGFTGKYPILPLVQDGSGDLYPTPLTMPHVSRSSILDFMGVASNYVNWENAAGDPGSVLQLDLGFILTYLNIFRNYYANNQEDNFPVYGSWLDDPLVPNTFLNNTLDKLDHLFKELRMFDNGGDILNLLTSSELTSGKYPGLNWFIDSYLPVIATPFGGLLSCTYLPDQYVNLLNDKVGSVSSKVQVTDNSFSIDTLRFQNKLQKLIDRYDVSGGRFSNWLRTVWGVKTRRDMDIPELMGVAQSIIDPSQVSALAQTGEPGKDGSTDLGQFGGHFDNFNGHRRHSIRCSTSGRIMVIVTLVPMVDYCQNIDRDLLELNFADEYIPQLAQLGFQKVPKSDYSVLPTLIGGNLDSSLSGDPFSEAVGKQVAWLKDMTATNRLHGEFSNGGYFDYWCLQRRYTKYVNVAPVGESPSYTGTTIITQYVSPLDYQYPFVAQSINDPNWMLQMSFDVRAVRPIGKRFMPTFE